MRRIAYCLTHDCEAQERGCRGLLQGGSCDVMNLTVDDAGRAIE